MSLRRLIALAVVLVAAAAGLYIATPYARAASLIVRAANLGGRAEALANYEAHSVTVRPRHTVPTRYGDVAAHLYVPDDDIDRTAQLIPGIHAMSFDDPRLTALAADLAASGVIVMSMAFPVLHSY